MEVIAIVLSLAALAASALCWKKAEKTNRDMERICQASSAQAKQLKELEETVSAREAPKDPLDFHAGLAAIMAYDPMKHLRKCREEGIDR